jgi:hypothetical protein
MDLIGEVLVEDLPVATVQRNNGGPDAGIVCAKNGFRPEGVVF